MCSQRSLVNMFNFKNHSSSVFANLRHFNNGAHNAHRNFSKNIKRQPRTPASSSVYDSVSAVPQKVDPLTRECVEVQIPVPWGYLRGKWWGPTDKRPIFGPHGWQDNCGTFDRLAPLLPPDVGFLALDSPGHGYSSAYPYGFNYGLYDMPKMIRKLSQEFQWKKVSLLGHSLGSIQSFLYSSMFPDQVDFYIGIDILMPLTSENDGHLPSVYASTVDRLIKYSDLLISGSEPPSYPYDKCIEVYVGGTFGSVSEQFTPYILNRGLRPSRQYPKQFYFSRDPRLKVASLPSISKADCFIMLENLKAPMCLIRALDSPFNADKAYGEEVVSRLEKTVKHLELISVPGTHHVHLLSPEIFVEQVNSFIRKYDTEDRSQKANLIDKLFVKKYF